MSYNQKSKKNQSQKIILIFALAAVGVLLIMLGGGGTDEGKTVAANASAEQYGEQSAQRYAEHLESRIADICGEVRGVGEVSVFVSLEGGYRALYATDAQSGSSGHKEQIVMSGSGAGREAVISAYQNPEIGGVAIVCDGASSASVRAELVRLVSAALGISTNKIFVSFG